MDDESENLHWHALNYRTAAPQHAEEMWQELVACVERKVAAERERWRATVEALLPMAEESVTRPELDLVCLDARGILKSA